MDGWEYPESVLREAVVNALVHRDYSISGADIMLAIFSDRIEIQSPGRLPNTVTPEGMKAGVRYARNQTLVNVMRDYGYVDARGMGVRNKIIPGMRAHNGTEPDLIAEEHRFTVRLWKEPCAGGPPATGTT
jgi:ATP-dependent DNA helicase RecG